MSFLDALELVVPLIVPIVVGWLLVQGRVVTPDAAGPLATVFLWVCAPAIIIVLLASEDLDDLVRIDFTVALFLVIAIAYAGTFLAFRYVLQRQVEDAAFAALNASGFNSVAIGLPVLLALIGHRAAVPVFIATVIFLAILIPLTLTIVAYARGGSSPASAFGNALRSTAKNPIVVATVIGIVLAAVPGGLPKVADDSLTVLGQATIVTALVSLGIALDLRQVRDLGSEVLGVSAIRIVICPALAVAGAYIFTLGSVWAATLIVLAGLPTAKTVFVLSEKLSVYRAETTGIVALTTLAGIIVLPVLIWMSEQLFPGAFT